MNGPMFDDVIDGPSGRTVQGQGQQYKPMDRHQMVVNIKTRHMEIQFKKTVTEPNWTQDLQNLTVICNEKFCKFCKLDLHNSVEDEDFCVSQEKFLPLMTSSHLSHLSTLVIPPTTYNYEATPYVNLILSLAQNLKSFSLSYDMVQESHGGPYITLDLQLLQKLQELSITTSNSQLRLYGDFIQFLDKIKLYCYHNLKSITFQEIENVFGGYSNEYIEFTNEIFGNILEIIDNNSKSLEKLELGISLITVDPTFSSKLLNISATNLKYLDLRAVNPKYEKPQPIGPPVIEILNKLPGQPGQLTTLKLSMTEFPHELFQLIPQKFPHLKSLSLKASKFSSAQNSSSWSFLQSLIELEELEITKFILNQNESNFGLISDKFPAHYLQNLNLRKLVLKGADQVKASTLLNGIVGMSKLKELTLTGSKIFVDDLMTICKNLKELELLQISNLYLNPQSTTAAGREINSDILKAFSSLKYLKELSIEIWDGDFSQVLKSLSFPFLKTLTLINANLGKEEIENLIGLNRMLKVLNIVRLLEVSKDKGHNQDKPFEIVNKRKNLKINFSTKLMVRANSTNGFGKEVREDYDPDSKSLKTQLFVYDL